MRRWLVVVLLFCCFYGFSQDYNLSLLGTLDYESDGSDIWGYVDEQGTEYALMGVRNGTAIISLADPTNPVEVAFINGGNNIWRDLKTFGTYAYVTTEAPDGILVIDLSDIANGNTTHLFYQPEFEDIVWGKLLTIHNLYIDKDGFCYIAGSNLNNGGVLIFDLNQDPMEPPLVGKGEDIYSHDVYVRDNICWSSNVNDGHFSAIDVSDKTNPVTLAYQETTFNFSHNAWLSDDGQYLFTTDELPNANIDAYDVSDLDNIKLIDTWIPPTTVGDGVIPHNAHVFDDYLVISYYTDGVKVVDAHRPSNLVEVGSYDTHTENSNGFHGCWGAYPFLPSGIVLASDIERGLFVLEPTYQRACYLEGIVEDMNGVPLNGVSISLNSGLEDESASNGSYATGQVTAGVFQVTYSKIGYYPQTVEVTLVNGEVTIQDIVLEAEPTAVLTVKVVHETTGNPIPEATIRVQGAAATSTFDAVSDDEGNFVIGAILPNQYQVFAGKWGYTSNTENITASLDVDNQVVVTITEGYEDPFAVDLGWVENGDASAGLWELGKPNGTTYNNAPFNANMDVDSDVADWCYVTGNGGGNAGSDDVDGGTTTLTSPVFDLTGYENPRISYQAWFMNGGGQDTPNDQLDISILNGTQEVLIETIDDNTNGWDFKDIRVLDYIGLSDNMTFKVETSDDPGSGNLVEAGLDDFIIYDTEAVNINAEILVELTLEISPNPFRSQLSITLPKELGSGYLDIYDTLGRLVHQETVGQQTFVSVNTSKWANGLYQIVYTSKQTSITHKVIKQ